MSDRNGSDFASFFSGLLMGGIIGAATALLMAPQSGEETRRLLRERGIELRDMSTEALEKAAAEARSRAEELTRMARQQADEMRGQAQQMRSKGEAAVEGLRNRGEAAVEDLRARGEAAIDAAMTPPKSGRKSSNDAKKKS